MSFVGLNTPSGVNGRPIRDRVRPSTPRAAAVFSGWHGSCVNPGRLPRTHPKDLLGLEGPDSLLDWPREQVFAEWLDHALIALVWHGWLFVQVQQWDVAQAQRQASEAQLELLRARLEPHFFFNALNTAIALTQEAPAAAEQVLLDLSALLRQSLNLGQMTQSDLRAELALVRRYLAIEAARFEQNLQVEYAIDPAALDTPVPPFVLQPLVNNAIKHGMRTSPMPLRVVIAVQATPRGGRVEITNTGRLGDASTAGHGIGTRNLAARLAAERPGRHRFELTEADGQVRAVVEVW